MVGWSGEWSERFGGWWSDGHDRRVMVERGVGGVSRLVVEVGGRVGDVVVVGGWWSWCGGG